MAYQPPTAHQVNHVFKNPVSPPSPHSVHNAFDQMTLGTAIGNVSLAAAGGPTVDATMSQTIAWQRKNSWRHDHGRQPYRLTQPTSSVRSSLS